MAGCKDIIVNIQDFNSADTYVVTVRLKGSIVSSSDLLPTYTITASGAQVIFKNLPDGLYEVSIKRTCKTGGVSITPWQDVIAATCPAPVEPFIDTITGTTAKANWTGLTGESYEFSLDGGTTWEATTNYAYHDMTGLTAGRVYIILIRRKCGAYSYSLPVTLSFTTTTPTPEFTTQILEKLCVGNEFVGYRVRFSLAGGLASVGSTYRIRYTDYDGTVFTLLEKVVAGGDTLQDVAKEIANAFIPENFTIGTDYASFEIISDQQKAPSGVKVNCQDVDMTNAYMTDII